MFEKTEPTTPPFISVIMPAYYEEAVVGSVVNRVCSVLGSLKRDYEIIVVDDGSQDDTARCAREAGAKVISHPYNIGNGAAVKTGIRHAQGKVLVILDADGQHPPEDIPRLLEWLDPYDMVVGARTSESESSWHRNIANKIYNWFASYVCGRKIEDLTSGFRIIKADIAKEFVYLLPNTFSYPSTITLAIIRAGFSLKYVPIVTTRRVGRSKINLLQDGVRFLTIILKVSVFFAPFRVFGPISAILFLLGFGWYVYAVFFVGRGFPPTSIVVLLTSVLVFLMGLISEQITQLRYNRTR